MRLGTFIKSMAFVILVSFVGLSQTARESFDYAGGDNPYLVGKGGAENGFGGPWKYDTGVDSLVIINDTTFTYDDLFFDIPHTPTNLGLFKPGSWESSARYKRALAQNWPDAAGTQYWVSYLLEVREAPTGNTYFMVKLYNSGEIMAIGKGGGGTTYSCGSGWPGGAGDDVSTTEVEGGPVWLVVRIDMSGDDSDERTFMWINPDPAEEPDTTNADVKRWSGIDAGIDSIAIEFGGEDIGMILSWDEIRLGTTYADVSSEFTGVTTHNNAIPEKYAVSQNYPNPFNPTTNIRFAVKDAGLVTIKLYNLIGQEVATILNEYKNAGTYNVDFNAAGLTSGVYLYKITAGNFTETKKMTLLK